MQRYCEIPTLKGTMRGFFHIPNQTRFPVCLIFHGFTGNKTGTKFSYVSLARLLESSGIGTLRMDFLGSGESDLYFKDMTFDDELSCARVLLEEVKKMDNVTEIYVLGHSMGGCIASELAKLYPEDIKKLVLWAPAFNLPNALSYLIGNQDKQDIYDHNGFEISHQFVEDILSRDFYKDLNLYKNQLLIIHGTKDVTVPYRISERYLKEFHNPIFYPIENGSHNYDSVDHIKKVIKLSFDFLKEDVK